MSDESAEHAGHQDHEYPPTPFSFKLMVTLGGLYIGWRVIELVIRFIRWVG